MRKKFLFLLIAACVYVFTYILLLWGFQWYIGESLPEVKFSVSRQRVMAVKNFKGEDLPLSPLPDKYEKIYVE